MSEKEALPAKYSFRFRLEEEEFFTLAKIISKTSQKKRRKKMIGTGIIAVICGICVIIAKAASLVSVNPGAYIVGAGLMAIGLYMVMYYDVFFLKKLRASSKAEFLKNDYCRNDVTVSFFETEYTEISGEKQHETRFKYSKTEGVLEKEGIYFLVSSATRYIPVPIRAIPEEKRDEFAQYFAKLSLKTKAFKGKEVVYGTK